MHKLREHHKPKPAASLLRAGIEKIADAPPSYRGLDVVRLSAEGHAALKVLENDAELTAEQVPSIVKLER